MEILVYCVEEMKDGNIKTIEEFRTREEAEDIRAQYEDRFTRIVKREKDSTELDLKDAFIALCIMTECYKCPYNCVGENVKPWNEMDISEKATIIKRMSEALRER